MRLAGGQVGQQVAGLVVDVVDVLRVVSVVVVLRDILVGRGGRARAATIAVAPARPRDQLLHPVRIA